MGDDKRRPYGSVDRQPRRSEYEPFKSAAHRCSYATQVSTSGALKDSRPQGVRGDPRGDPGGIEGSGVLAIDGQWGTGKTTFTARQLHATAEAPIELDMAGHTGNTLRSLEDVRGRTTATFRISRSRFGRSASYLLEYAGRQATIDRVADDISEVRELAPPYRVAA